MCKTTTVLLPTQNLKKQLSGGESPCSIILGQLCTGPLVACVRAGALGGYAGVSTVQSNGNCKET
jgi:hypothetical protein